MARGAKYRLIAVDRPGYMGVQEVYPKKEIALEHAEAFMRTHAPRWPASFAESSQRAYVLVEETYRSGDHYTVTKWYDDHGVWKKTRGNPSPKTWSTTMPIDKRRRNIILDEDLVNDLFQWHGGQDSSVYSLASTGLHDYVSVSMIERAIRELESFKSTIKGKDRKHLSNTIGGLYVVAESPNEYTAKAYGLGDKDSGYDMYIHRSGRTKAAMRSARR